MFSLILFVTLIKKTDKFQENQKTSNTKTDIFQFFRKNPSNGDFLEIQKSYKKKNYSPKL